MNKWKIKNNEELELESDNCELRESEECTRIGKKCSYFPCPRLSRGLLDRYDRELIASFFEFRQKVPIAGLLIATTLYSIQSESSIFKIVVQIWLLTVTGLWMMSNIKGTFINLELKKFNLKPKKLLNLNFDYAFLIAITATVLIFRSTLIIIYDSLLLMLGGPSFLVIRINNVDYNTPLLANESASIVFFLGSMVYFMFGLAVYAILKTSDEQYIREMKQEDDEKIK